MNGTRDENPKDIGLFSLVAEDFRTHGRNILEPGFLALVSHRFGNWRMGIRSKLIRAPLTVMYDASHLAINWIWGIDLGYSVKVGRRVRLWHHGCIVLNARSIGDDVHIRHNTTMGVARRHEPDKRPTIEAGVDIGVGACILGDVTVGAGSTIGAGSIVVNSFATNTVLAGSPARTIRRLET